MSWLIIGAGRSGKSAAKVLASKNQTTYLVDDRFSNPNPSKEDYSTTVSVEWVAENISKIKNVILSPGVSLSHRLCELARDAKLPVMSEVEFARQMLNSIFIGVTGTNGKSTSVSMICHLLEKAGFSVAVAGNIGKPLSEFILKDEQPQYYVVELSSYQLEHSSNLDLDYSLFYNFAEDHLDRHGSIESYFCTKSKIISQTRTKAIISQAVSELGHRFHPDFFLRFTHLLCIPIQAPVDSAPENMLPHDFENAFYSCQVLSQITGLSWASFIDKLHDFKNLPYRNQQVAKIGSYIVVNDSKSTNVSSTAASLEGARGPVLLLLGGKSKGESFCQIKKYSNKIKSAMVFGESRKEIFDQLQGHVSCQEFPTLSDLLEYLSETIYDIKCDVLFSPGCLSFDEFKDFEHRGLYFTTKVREVTSRSNQDVE